jgi:hypothetical protein
MIATRFASRIPVARVVAAAQSQQRALLSTRGTVAVEKLRNLLEEYRLENYTQELPGRFKKEVIKAATQSQESDDRVALDSFSRVLMNIGCQNRLTSSEIQSIFEELGNGKEIPTKNLTKIL